jgi:hypothetical protein
MSQFSLNSGFISAVAHCQTQIKWNLYFVDLNKNKIDHTMDVLLNLENTMLKQQENF